MEIKDVENLAELARLGLRGEEKEKILADMGSILEYVRQIESVPVGDIKAENKLYNVWREDKIIEQDFSRDLIVDQFPDSQDRFLKVKKII